MKPKWKLKKTLAIIGPKPKAKRAPKETDPGSNPKYLAWLREQPCAVKKYPLPRATPCRGIVEAHHHTGGRGRGQKSNDLRAFPLCKRHHTGEFHAPQWGGVSRAKTTFTGWGKQKRREWQDAMVEKYIGTICARQLARSA